MLNYHWIWVKVIPNLLSSSKLTMLVPVAEHVREKLFFLWKCGYFGPDFLCIRCSYVSQRVTFSWRCALRLEIWEWVYKDVIVCRSQKARHDAEVKLDIAVYSLRIQRMRLLVVSMSVLHVFACICGNMQANREEIKQQLLPAHTLANFHTSSKCSGIFPTTLSYCLSCWWFNQEAGLGSASYERCFVYSIMHPDASVP